MSAMASSVTSRVVKHAIFLLGVALIVSWTAPARSADPDWKAVEAALGKTGQLHGRQAPVSQALPGYIKRHLHRCR